MDTPSSCPSTVSPDKTPQSPHISPLDEESLSSQPPLPPSIYIGFLPPPPTKFPPTEPIDEIFHKNLVEPLSIRTLNLVHKETTKFPSIPTS